MVARRAAAGWLFQLVVFNGLMAAGPVPKDWPLVHIPDPVARRATIEALEAASQRLEDVECRRILTDFRNTMAPACRRPVDVFG